MQVFHSKINTNSQQYKANIGGMKKLLEKYNLAMEESRFQGKEKSIARARKRGKLLGRERLELLLDKDSPFLELLPLAGNGTKRWIRCRGVRMFVELGLFRVNYVWFLLI